MSLGVQTVFDFCRRETLPVVKPERLFFALMPDEASAEALARFTERLILENDLPAKPVKPARLHIALQCLSACSHAMLYGAKLAGQSVPAAGLTLSFDTLATMLSGGRRLALLSEDEALAGIARRLDTALDRNRLRHEGGQAHITLATGAARLSPQSIPPLNVKVSGLALLRGEGEDFQVLRRWPLNTPKAVPRLASEDCTPLQSPPVLQPKLPVPQPVSRPARKVRKKAKGVMPVTIYGIKNCDTMKKAFAWLDSHGIAYSFHDYKKAGVTKAQLTEWCKALGWEKVINRAGPTFRKLPDEDKEGLNQTKAIALMMGNPSMIKRPLIDTGKTFELGFKPERYEEIFG